MRLVDGVGILITQLVKNGGDFVVVLCRDELSYDSLKSGGVSVNRMP